jgi:hypothetical protein
VATAQPRRHDAHLDLYPPHAYPAKSAEFTAVKEPGIFRRGRLATAQGPRFQSRMAVNMKRLWGRILQGLLAILVVLYLGDWITLRVRTGAQGTNSVQVEQFLRTPLKGQKEEFDYMGTVAEPCVPALFPHRSEAPCWWVERHKIQWVSP